MFLFSNLTQILNLPAIYIIPFRFMNYKEESISLDKNTLKLPYALTPHIVLTTTSAPLLSPLQDCGLRHDNHECTASDS